MSIHLNLLIIYNNINVYIYTTVYNIRYNPQPNDSEIKPYPDAVGEDRWVDEEKFLLLLGSLNECNYPKHNKTQPVEVALKSWSIRRHLLFGLVPDLHHQHDVGSWWFCRHFIFKRFCIWTTHILGWARVRFSLRDLQTTHESLGKRMLALQLASHKRHPKGTAIPLHSKMNLNEVERFSTSMERGFGCTQKMISCDIILSCMSPV